MKYAEKAIHLDDRCQHAYKALAWAHFLSGNKEEANNAIDLCVLQNPRAASMIGNLGLALICMGNYIKGHGLLLKAMIANNKFSIYIKLGLALYSFKEKKFGDVLIWTERINNLNIPIVSLLRIAAISKINGDPQAIKSLTGYDTGDKKFIKSSADLLHRFIHDEEMKKELSTALNTVGLTVK